jgi:hypothetical protein
MKRCQEILFDIPHGLLTFLFLVFYLLQTFLLLSALPYLWL